MKPRRPDESAENYIKRLEASNRDLRRVEKHAMRLNDALSRLGTEGSLVFQAMAEKAGVREHPSVTQAVKFFDSLVGLQWENGEPIPAIEWPDDWDFESEDQWAGDADMLLHAPLQELSEMLEAFSWKLPDKYSTPLREASAKIDRLMRSRIDQIKEDNGFVPRVLTINQAPDHIGWALLDLAQDMHFANFMLRRDLRASVYRRVCADLYALANAEFADEPPQIDIKIFGSEAPF